MPFSGKGKEKIASLHTQSCWWGGGGAVHNKGSQRGALLGDPIAAKKNFHTNLFAQNRVNLHSTFTGKISKKRRRGEHQDEGMGKIQNPGFKEKRALFVVRRGIRAARSGNNTAAEKLRGKGTSNGVEKRGTNSWGVQQC